MKKESVSVLKPRNKNSIVKSPKKNVGQIEKPVAGPRDSKKAKIVDVQQVDMSGMLKNLKRKRLSIVDEKSRIENSAKIDDNDSKKISDHAVNKMAAKRKPTDETRVRATKKAKKQAERSLSTTEDGKNDGEAISAPETTKLSTEPSIGARKKRKSEVTSRKTIENVGDLKLTKKRVIESIRAIKKLMEKQRETKKSLLPAEDTPVLLQIECVKVPKTPRMRIRPYLPHKLVGPLDDVALFVPDLKKGRRRDYEPTVEHWETLLREKGVDCVKEIIPLNKLKTEYSQFEMQRKLAMSFDYFLADGRIVGHLTHLLGSGFFKRQTAPTPVKLGRDELKKELDFALHKTCVTIHPYGNSHAMRVGRIGMEEKKLAENVWTGCEELAKEYPGGWRNIRCIRVKTNSGPAVPIYLNLVSKNDVPIPVVKPKRPRAYETVKGELTTVPGGATVRLTPEGKVYVKRLKDYGEVEEDGDDDAEEEQSEVENDKTKEEEEDDE